MPAGKVNLYRLLRQLETEEEKINFLRKHKLIPETMTSIKCLDTLNLVYPLFSKASKFKYFKCPCNPSEKIAITKNTLLYGSNLPVRQFVVLMYGFCYRFKYADVKREADLEGADEPGLPGYNTKKLGDKTISHWWEIFRLCVGQDMVDRQFGHKIGGEGFEVEIDESLFGGVKYGRGNPFRHRQCWVLGGKCRQTGECFLEICPDGLRNGETLKEIILRRVARGTTIYTDQWKGYYGLESLGFDWDKEETTVNHSKQFINENNKRVHTQGIESKWRQVKRQLPSSGR